MTTFVSHQDKLAGLHEGQLVVIKPGLSPKYEGNVYRVMKLPYASNQKNGKFMNVESGQLLNGRPSCFIPHEGPAPEVAPLPAVGMGVVVKVKEPGPKGPQGLCVCIDIPRQGSIKIAKLGGEKNRYYKVGVIGLEVVQLPPL